MTAGKKIVFGKMLGLLLISIIFGLMFLFVLHKSDFSLKVTIAIKAEQNDYVQLFYTTYRGFNESESISQAIRLNDTAGEIMFQLPGHVIRHLRIDPGRVSKSFSIKHIKIETGQTQKLFSGNEIPAFFELQNLRVAENENTGYLRLTTQNIDPQLIYKGDLSQDFKQQDKSVAFSKRIIIIGFLSSILMVILFGYKIYKWIVKQHHRLLNSKFEKLNTAYILDFLQKNKTIILSSLLIGIIAYGYELFNFSMSIDDEIASLKNAGDLNFAIVTGRWGFYLLNFFFQPYSIMPFYTTAIAIFCIGATASLFIIHQKGNLPSKLVFLVIFISSPVHSYYLAFNASFYYTMGMLLTIISYTLLIDAVGRVKTNIRYVLLASLLMAFSISLYQSMLAFFLVFVAYFVFQEALEARKTYWISIRKMLIAALAVSILGLLFYKAGDFLSRLYFLPSEYVNNTYYLNDFLAWGKMPYLSNIKNLFNNTIEFLIGMQNTDIYLGFAEKTSLLLFVILAYFVIKAGSSNKIKFTSLIFLIVLLLSPFAVMYLNGKMLPVRAMMSLPLMIALLWFATYQKAGAIIRRMMLVAVVLIFINNTYINTRLFYASQTAWAADKVMAASIAERVYQLNPITKNEKISIAFIGDYKHKENHLFFQSNVFGTSFFNWDTDQSFRKFALMKTMGFNNFVEANIHEYQKHYDEIAKMPTWPLQGSVVLIKGLVIVKLSQPDYLAQTAQIP